MGILVLFPSSTFFLLNFCFIFSTRIWELSHNLTSQLVQTWKTFFFLIENASFLFSQIYFPLAFACLWAVKTYTSICICWHFFVSVLILFLCPVFNVHPSLYHLCFKHFCLLYMHVLVSKLLPYSWYKMQTLYSKKWLPSIYNSHQIMLKYAWMYTYPVYIYRKLYITRTCTNFIIIRINYLL